MIVKHVLLLFCLLHIFFGKVVSQSVSYSSQSIEDILDMPLDYKEVVFPFYKGVACVLLDSGYVFVDTSGLVISKVYDWVGFFNDWDVCMVNKGGEINEYGVLRGGKYGVVDLQGKEVIVPEYDMIFDFNDCGIALMNQGGHYNEYGDFMGGMYGFIHFSGQVRMKPKYAFVGEFQDGSYTWVNVGGWQNALAEGKGGKYGYVNREGREVVPPIYKFIGPIESDGICWINIGGKRLFDDKKAQKQITKRIKYLYEQKASVGTIEKEITDLEDELSEGRVDIQGDKILGGKYGFYDVFNEKLIVAPIYTNAVPSYENGYARVGLKEKYGYIDTAGDVRVPLKYSYIGNFRDGYASVRGKNHDLGVALWSFVDTVGNQLTDFIFSHVYPFEDNVATVSTTLGGKYRKYGLLSKNGDLITECKYNKIGIFYNGVAIAEIDSQFLYLRHDGQELTPLAEWKLRHFDEGMGVIEMDSYNASVNKKGQRIDRQFPFGGKKHYYGFVDTNGIALSDFIYTWVGPFSEDRIAVTTPKGGGWLDYALIESIPLIYQGVGTFHDSIASVKVKNAWGYMGWDGEMRIDCEYDRVSWRFYDDIAWVKRDGKYGYINILGNEIVPCIYSSNTKSFTLGK